MSASTDVRNLQRRSVNRAPNASDGARRGADGDAHASRFRAERLKYAVATSLLSKGGTAILQLLAIPIAIHSLGVQGYAIYVAVAAVVGWLGMATIGVGPALVVQMAAAAAAGDRLAQRRLFTSALFPVGINVLLLTAAVPVLMAWQPVTRLFSSEFAGQEQTILTCLWIMAAMQLIQPLFAVVEAAQTGYQEQYILNLRGLLGNLGCVAALVLIPYWPTVIYMVLAMQGPQFLMRLANAGWFFWKRTFLVPAVASFNWRDSRSLVGDGLFFSLAGSASAYLCHQFPVLVLGRTVGANASASFAAGMSLIVAAFGVVSMICIPLWSAVSDSLSRGDAAWARRACDRVVASCTAYGLVVGLLLAVFGRSIFWAWLGGALHPSGLFFVSLGIYFPLLVWEYVHYMMLIAVRGIKFPSLLYTARGLVSAVAVVLLSRAGQDYAATAGLCLSVMLLTAVTYPCLIHRSLTARTVTGVAGSPQGVLHEPRACSN